MNLFNVQLIAFHAVNKSAIDVQRKRKQTLGKKVADQISFKRALNCLFVKRLGCALSYESIEDFS